VERADAPTYFFVHVMKTGGSTFTQHIQANFAEDEVYPPSTPDLARMYDYYLVDNLRTLDPEARRRIRAYVGHFPYVASKLVDADVTLTLLREPVARTVSFLKHCRRHHEQHRGLRLEEIYEDPWQFPTRIHNYQAKLFAMGLDDKLESHLDVIDVDDERLARAKAAIEEVDLLGLQEHYSTFVDDVRAQLGWTIGTVYDLQVSLVDVAISDSFRARIEEDNAADLALYEHAREVWATRHPDRPAAAEASG
jgi:hypothetical protein